MALWDRGCRDKQPDMRDTKCPILSVIVYQEHMAGHSEAVLSEKRLVNGKVEVDYEEDIEAVPQKRDKMLGEVCVTVLRDEEGVDL